MKPWMIMLSSAVVAVVAAAGVALPELLLGRHSGAALGFEMVAPALLVTVLAGYAVCAILLTVANLVGSCVLLRHRLAQIPLARGPRHPDWNAAFEATGLGQLSPALASPPLGPGSANRTIALQTRFRPETTRREMARLYYIWAARTHFLSALIVLAAAAALGLAEQHGTLPVSSGAIPTVPAGLIVLGLILLAALGRIAVDVAVEPMVDLFCRLPAEPVETVLLRRAVELLETSPTGGVVEHDGALTAALQIPGPVVDMFEDGRRALFEAIERLKTTTDGLAAGTRSAIERLEAAVRDSNERRAPEAAPTGLNITGLSRLEEAVAALTAALERAPAAALASALSTGSELPIPNRDADPQLAQELKKLLEEIGTAS
jgi:hypothetical protein